MPTDTTKGPAAQELSSYLYKLEKSMDAEETMVVMGDMNRTEVEFAQAFASLGSYQQIPLTPL